MMKSLAWDVSEDDVFLVLQRHGEAERIEEDAVAEAHELVGADVDRVAEAVLFYTDMDDQTNAALSEIEDILIEEGFLSSTEKQFAAP